MHGRRSPRVMAAILGGGRALELRTLANGPLPETRARQPSLGIGPIGSAGSRRAGRPYCGNGAANWNRLPNADKGISVWSCPRMQPILLRLGAMASSAVGHQKRRNKITKKKGFTTAITKEGEVFISLGDTTKPKPRFIRAFVKKRGTDQYIRNPRLKDDKQT
jgi:hypothetical protein